MNSENINNLSIEFSTPCALYKAYMPYIKQGALFVETSKPFQLNDEVMLSIKFFGESFVLQGKVVWLRLPGARDGEPAGVGVQLLGLEGEVIREKVESYLERMTEGNNTKWGD